MNTATHSIAVIGGGISGLAAAWYLTRQRPQVHVTLYDSSQKFGGVLQTDRVDDFLVEQAADMFVTQPDDALQLCRELGIENDLISTQPVQDRAFIGMGTDLFPVPEGLSMMVPTMSQPILDTKLLTEDGKRRFLAETDVPARQSAGNEDDESLKSFAVRRFGLEAYEKIIQPMVSGIYTADPEKLSMQATMKRFIDMERTTGSLIKATANSDSDRSARGARYNMFRAPKLGIGRLVKTLVDQLNAASNVTLIRSSTVTSISPKDRRWSVRANNDQAMFDGIICAGSAYRASKLLGNVDPELAQTLREIETASSAIVALGIQRNQLTRPFNGFGIIYPHIDGGQVIAISFSSNKFAGRCSTDQLLIRVFMGGALQSELVDLDDESLFKIAIDQLDKSLGFTATPSFKKVYRWSNTMPQYHLGHVDRVRHVQSRVDTLPHFALAGNSYHGVGIPACVASGKKAAQAICNGLQIK